MDQITEPQIEENSDIDSLIERWPSLPVGMRQSLFESLTKEQAEQLFLSLSATDQFELVQDRSTQYLRDLLKQLDPDDAVDLLQYFEVNRRTEILASLDAITCKELTALLAYKEDEAGGLMNPRFIRLRPDVSADVAIRYLRAQAKRPIETIHYLYVLDVNQKLLGVLSFRDLIMAPVNLLINDIMTTEVVTVAVDTDQEEVSRLFSQTGLSAVPVIDHEGLMQGIITLDDVLDIVQEDATEDMQKMGGVESLDAGYMQTGIPPLVRKRAFWLSILFVGEIFTASAMQAYEHELAKAVILATFIPLIISSGGNSGSQATSLIIRALALGDVRPSDWWRVLSKEIICGLSLGLILAFVAWSLISFYPNAASIMGENHQQIAYGVSAAIICVVLWGNLIGSMLPFILKALKLDPATASAPLVATISDISGLVIYFSLAKAILDI